MEIYVYEQLPDYIFDEVQVVHEAVFDGSHLKKEKLINRKNFLALVAIVDDAVAGFKFGYEHEDGVFYSWLGGVHPQY